MACREFEMGRVGLYSLHTEQLSTQACLHVFLLTFAFCTLVYRPTFALSVSTAILFECALHFFFFSVPNKKKCERYWPEKQGQRFVCEPFTVYCVSMIWIYPAATLTLESLSSGPDDFKMLPVWNNGDVSWFCEPSWNSKKLINSFLFFVPMSQDSEELKGDYLSRTLRVTFSNVGTCLNNSTDPDWICCFLKKQIRAGQNLSCTVSSAFASLLTPLPCVTYCFSGQPNCEAAPLCQLARSRSSRLHSPHPANSGWDASQPRPRRRPHLHPLQVRLLMTAMKAQLVRCLAHDSLFDRSCVLALSP